MDIPHLLAHPDELNQETLYDLRRIVGIHPTYHAARILFLQNLFLLHDTTFDQELRRAALLVPDRRVLCNITQFGGLQPMLDRAHQPEEAIKAPAPDTTPTAKEVAAAAKPVPTVTPAPTEAPAAAKPAPAAAKPAPAAAKPASVATPAPTEAPAAAKPALEEQGQAKRATVPEASASGSIPADAPSIAPAAASADAPAPSAPAAAAPSTRRPRKKYASDDTTLTLLDNFLDSTPAPLQRRRIKADPSTDYMAYLTQADENDDAIAAPHLSAPPHSTHSDTGAHRMNELIDGFITSYQNGIQLSEDPDVPEDIIVYPDEAPLADDTDAPTAAATTAPAAPDAGLSETLASIYIKQQKYDRALEVMTKIHTTAAKSNPYLADQVRFLQKLAINSRHKR